MFFSMVVPVYNVKHYIDKCLESIVTQDFSSFEVIVVDDGSTDGTGARCDVYGEKYANVTVIHQENKGVSAARNVGLDAARGDWILFCDSDDWIVPGMLRKLHAQIEEEAADLYSYNARQADEQGNTTENMIFVTENSSVTFYNEKDRFDYITGTVMEYKVGWEVWSRVFRRSIIEENKLRFQEFSEVFAEDYLFTFQYLLYAKRVRHLCSMYYFYRQRGKSLLHGADKGLVIKRLYRWAEAAYRAVEKAKLPYVKKHYEEVYSQLLNHHLQYMLATMPQAEVKKELGALREKRLHRKWLKRLRKRKQELWKDMRVVKWM